MPASSRLRRRLTMALAVALLAVGTPLLANVGPADATEFTAAGFVTSARVDPVETTVGQTVSITVSVKSNSTRKALIDVEVYDQSGRKVFQKYWDNRSLRSGRTQQLNTSWATQNLAAGSYTVQVGVFATGWGSLIHWNNDAATVTLTDATSTATSPTTAATTTAPTTTIAVTTTTAAPTTTAATTTTTTTTTTSLAPTTTLVAGVLSTSAAASPSPVAPGASVTLSATTRSDVARNMLVDLEAYDSSGQKVFQFWWDNQSFTAGQSRTLSTNWAVPSSLAAGTYTLKVGLFGAGWGPLVSWNDSRAR